MLLLRINIKLKTIEIKTSLWFLFYAKQILYLKPFCLLNVLSTVSLHIMEANFK